MYFKKKRGKRNKSKQSWYNKQKTESLYNKVYERLSEKTSFAIRIIGRPLWTSK